MADFGLSLIELSIGVVDVPAQGPVPGIIVEKADEAGAIFAVWFSVMESSKGNLPVMHVYDPDNRQVFTRMGAPASVEGELDYKDMAFRLRNLMGASLYSDLEGILDDEELMFMAVPEERWKTIGEVVGAAAPARRSWVSLGLGYLLMGYPTARGWYHGFAFEIAVIPVKRLNVFIDGGFAALPGAIAKEPAENVDLELGSNQILVGVGVRYDLLVFGPVALAPEAGFHLGMSKTRVHGAVDREFLELNPALWGGLAARFSIVERFALTLGMRFENLFVYETFKWGEATLLSIAPFRFTATAGISVKL
jgi:hypothetical protein